ncbi:MAG: DUF1592 domain-containing protein [Cyclobacteriaceae bacterium]
MQNPINWKLIISRKLRTTSNPIKWSIILTALLLLIAVIPLDNLSWVLQIFGRLHPLFVHLPIGILLALFGLEVLALFSAEFKLGKIRSALLWMVVLCAIPTVLAGALLAADGGYSSSINVHKWLGVGTALISIWLLVLEDQANRKGEARTYRMVLTANVLMVSLTGHFGGLLTHGSNYLTELLPTEIRKLLEKDDSEQLAQLISDHAVLSMEELSPEFNERIQPILTEYCYECHGDEKQKGGLQLNTLDADIVNGLDADKWRATLNMINMGDMPPKEETQLTDGERRSLVEWLTSSLKYAIELRKSQQETVMRRLTRNQYTNTLNELLKVPVRFGDVLPEDAKSEMGFSNNGEVLQISPLHMEYYQRIAREALDKAIGPEVRPAVTRYRVTIGKGIGKDKVAGKIGGYQSAPIDPEDFIIEILDRDGNVIDGEFSEEELDSIKLNIGLGMRGSTDDRYEVVEDGIVLYGALPHKEVTPKSWQGPSPNLKLLFRKVFPETGDFQFKVKASRGEQLHTNKEGLISLREERPIINEQTAYLTPSSATEIRNLEDIGGMFIPIDITQPSIAKFKFEAIADGYYQLDYTHPYVGQDGMPSVMLRIDNFRLDERLHLDENVGDTITTPLTLVYLNKGEHQVVLGGRFFTGFQSLQITHLLPAHPISQALDEESELSQKKYAADQPVMKVFAGTRTDDGMDYQTFDSHRNVGAANGAFEEYVFRGRLENLPIPEIDLNDPEILSNIMIIGLWNDYLIKDNRLSGPPLKINSLEFEAPYYETWPTPGYTSIFHESAEKNSIAYTREVIKRFAEKAFRRPLVTKEVDRYMSYYEQIRAGFDRYEDGVKEVLIAILCSPNFLYLPNSDEELDNEQYLLAARLSYFLWNAPPDAELLELARKGKLERNLDDQVERMIADDRIWNMIESFGKEWLRVDRHEAMSTNVSEYADFSRFVKQDMANETYHFVHQVLTENLSILNFIDSDFTMLNQNLAEFYGVDSVVGTGFRPVKLEVGLNRGGLLSQGAFLNGHSDGTQAHPIKRAVWLRSKILGSPPPPPPPNVPELDPDTPGFDQMTLKEQLEHHRNSPSCMDCHKKIDQYGIVFENYDAVGRYQRLAKGRPIDTKVTLPDMTEVEGIEGIKSYLMNQKKDVFTQSLVKHLFAYAIGRDVSFVDEEEILDIVDEVRSDDYRFQSVIEYIVTSPSFLGETD